MGGQVYVRLRGGRRARARAGPRPRYAAGSMFWFTRKTLSGS
jgi:hypothetical protein